MFAALTLFACVTSMWKVSLPITIANGSTLSVSYAANLMTLLLLGPQQAVPIAMAGVWTQCRYHQKQPYPPYRTIFSIAAAAITMAATGAISIGLGGSTLPHATFPAAKPLVGAIGAYFLVNTGLIAGAIALSSQRAFVETWGRDFLWSGASFIVAGTAGVAAAIVVAARRSLDGGRCWWRRSTSPTGATSCSRRGSRIRSGTPRRSAACTAKPWPPSSRRVRRSTRWPRRRSGSPSRSPK